MAESILNHTAGSTFHAMSGGLAPARSVDPMAMELLDRAGIRRDFCFTKPAEGFRGDSFIALDLVISCLDLVEEGYGRGWPGNPTLLHWRIPDPMTHEGRDSGRRNQFRSAFASLQRRIQLIVALPLNKLSAQSGAAPADLGERTA